MTMLPMAETAAADLRRWRLEHGLSQGELASALGVHWLTVQHWEVGRYKIPPYLHLALREVERQLTDDAA